MKEIKKILIANRGEIAVRVISTCREMGIGTVSIYAEDDGHLPHAYLADESYALGSGKLKDTYLNIEKIVDIAKKSKADAIHPGYGFLSENEDFVEAVEKAGIIFMGPTVTHMQIMGDKMGSKIRMEKLKVPLIPGYHAENQDEKLLNSEAKKIGYPVLIKASAGGGGKGMRIVNSESDFTEALASAKREAMNAFGDDRVLLEKYIVEPRHIEVQLVSDGQNNHFHFYERECSIQRRYQKIIEETPSPALSDELRKKICETAVTISAGINYRGAGTIEFILGPDNSFYFLEMNTRLQVEHPITEMVTGFDLVKLQIMAAEGKAFPFKQSDIKQKGHAFECRLYAEDPDNGFLPTVGTIYKIGHSHIKGVRLDCGYKDGAAVSTSYDPMLAKLITYSSNREDNLSKMYQALGDYPFLGFKNNRNYLQRIFKNEAFIKGKTHTHFIQEQTEKLSPEKFSDEDKALMIAATLLNSQKVESKSVAANTNENLFNTLQGFRNV